jgi:hypothetical protein
MFLVAISLDPQIPFIEKKDTQIPIYFELLIMLNRAALYLPNFHIKSTLKILAPPERELIAPMHFIIFILDFTYKIKDSRY